VFSLGAPDGSAAVVHSVQQQDDTIWLVALTASNKIENRFMFKGSSFQGAIKEKILKGIYAEEPT